MGRAAPGLRPPGPGAGAKEQGQGSREGWEGARGTARARPGRSGGEPRRRRAARPPASQPPRRAAQWPRVRTSAPAKPLAAPRTSLSGFRDWRPRVPTITRPCACPSPKQSRTLSQGIATLFTMKGAALQKQWPGDRSGPRLQADGPELPWGVTSRSVRPAPTPEGTQIRERKPQLSSSKATDTMRGVPASGADWLRRHITSNETQVTSHTRVLWRPRGLVFHV